MHSRRSSDTSVNELLKEGHAESPNGFVIKSQNQKIIKAGNRFNGYASNFTHDQKLQNKSNLCIYFKRKLLNFKVKEMSFYVRF